MEKKIRLLIADDHPLILEGLKSMFSQYTFIEIVGESADGRDAVEKAFALKPDVVFMDLSMPGTGGIEACSMIRNENPGIRVIAISQHEDEEYVNLFLKAGGSGYLLKNSSREEFITAIHSALAGKRYFSAQLSDTLISGILAKRYHDRNSSQQEVHLTFREKEILKLIAKGYTNQQISAQLHISLRTVETHRRNIMQKLNLKTAVALVKYALQQGMIGITD